MIFDVGANQGIYSLVALAASPNATVHAFEPTPKIAADLRRTAELNGLGGLSVNELAVFDKTGEAQLIEYGGSDGLNGGMNYLTSNCSAPAVPTGLQVAATRLDEFCEANAITTIDLMKVDVQGHEPAVIHGAGNLITCGRIEHIFLELNWSAEGSSDCPARIVTTTLSSAGYRFATPEIPLRWREPGRWLEGMSDVIAGSSAV
jgi:FkbM family methyltransferase